MNLPNFETSGTPVDELDGTLGLDGGNGSIDILGDNITSVEETTGHVLAMSWVTLDHLVGWLKAGVGNVSNSHALMVGLVNRQYWRIGDQRKVNPGVGHQVGLELIEVHVESSIKPQRCSDRRYNLRNKTVEVGIGWSLNIKIPI